MNAAIRAVVRTSTYHGCSVTGIQRGFTGLLQNLFIPLQNHSVAQKISLGGTFLKSSRCPEFKTREARSAAWQNMQQQGIDALVVIGGDGSFRAADLLVKTGHAGRANNGLIPVWRNGNTQGAWEMGFRPAADLAGVLQGAASVLIAGADPAGDDPQLAEALGSADFVVVQDIFLTETAKQADLVLPAQAFTEREGTYTNGERRVQRFYPAVPPLSGTLPDFAITARIGNTMKVNLPGDSPTAVFSDLAETMQAFAGLSYTRLAEVSDQDPPVSRKKMFYSGAGYDNQQGLGVQLKPAVQRGEPASIPAPKPVEPQPEGSLPVVGINRLYDHGSMLKHSTLLHQRLSPNAVWMHPDLAARFNLAEGQIIRLEVDGSLLEREVRFDSNLPRACALAVR